MGLEEALANSAYAANLAKRAFPGRADDDDVSKFNPNHGPDGRFSSGGGGGGGARSTRDRDGDRVLDDYRGKSSRGKVRVHATRASLTGASAGGDRRAALASRNSAAVSALVARGKRNRAIGAKAQATKAGTAKLRALIAQKPAKTVTKPGSPVGTARPAKLGPATRDASASYQRAMAGIKDRRKQAAARNIAGARALHAKTQRNRSIGAKAQATKAGKAKLLGLVAQSRQQAAGRRNKASYKALVQRGQQRRHQAGTRKLKALLRAS